MKPLIALRALGIAPPSSFKIATAAKYGVIPVKEPITHGAILSAVSATVFPTLFSILSLSNGSSLFQMVPSLVSVSEIVTTSLPYTSLLPSNSAYGSPFQSNFKSPF
jgi:hypothetical protein